MQYEIQLETASYRYQSEINDLSAKQHNEDAKRQNW